MTESSWLRKTAPLPPSGEAGDAMPDANFPDDPRIVEVVRDFLAALENGESPDRLEYAARYPELSRLIDECLEGLELIRGKRPSVPHSSLSRRSDVQNTLSPSSPLGDFQIVRELARGGMGIVYEAVQLSLGRRVALKVLPFAATFDARQLQRFKNEAQAAALLHHTNIVPIYAVGCERGVHFYAMQLIEGQSLQAVVRELRGETGLPAPSSGSDNLSSYILGGNSAEPANGPAGESAQPRGKDAAASRAEVSTGGGGTSFTSGVNPSSGPWFRRVAQLMAQAADALEHAHQMGVVHRDIKPANLLVNSVGQLWVTDFGLAQLQAETGLTHSGDLLGTFRYMSPEQTTGQRTAIDHRTDIYSLGATFYELLTLEAPFQGETRQALLYEIVHREPRPPRQANRAVPPELETIVLKAMAKNRAERYVTGADFAADLRRYLANQPILARRPSLIDRVRKWSRRHPSVVVAGVLLLLVVAVGLSVSNRLIAREQARTADALLRERLRANEAEDRFRQARQAVDLLIQLSEEELGEVPFVQGTRKRLLETALAFYQDFIEQRREQPESQAELTQVQERVRGILRELTILQREMLVGVLSSPVVRKELALTAEQSGNVAALVRKAATDRDEILRDTRGRADEQRRRFVQAAEDHERALRGVLTAEQFRRLRQIGIQSQGLFAFRDPEIVRTLGLTADQRGSIRDLEREIVGLTFRRPEMARPPGVPRPPSVSADIGQPSDVPPRAAVAVAPTDPGNEPFRPTVDLGGPPGDARWMPPIGRRESIERILKLLTDEQRQTWRDLTGDPSASLDDPPFPGPPRDR